LRNLFNRGDPLAGLKEEDFEPAEQVASTTSSTSTSSSSSSAATQPGSEEAARLEKLRSDMRSDMMDAEKFALTPDKLGEISKLNEQLEAVAPLLAPVPVFTAAVGNGTSPLTVPTEDGRKLAYFFTEKADAEAFLRAVQGSAKLEIDAQVIGASLQDIIKAYSTPEAKSAQETFVLIPTMAEVAAARQLMRSAGKDPSAPEQADQLGPHSGLVPVFWSEALAVQSAGGKQRKVLFFRMGDLSHMWKNLSEARKQAGEAGEEMPSGPTVQVSDLQTMAGLLVSANKTDDIMFLPSSNAIKDVQGGGGKVKGDGVASAAGYGADASSGAASSGGGDEGDDFGAGEEIEEEEAGGVI